tara:strand:+ start:1288 stop:1464 length:177 start_codon:yes stop_codon:yes gene_type:complete
VNNPARVTGISPRTIPERSVSTIVLLKYTVMVGDSLESPTLNLGNESLFLKNQGLNPI